MPYMHQQHLLDSFSDVKCLILCHCVSLYSSSWVRRNTLLVFEYARVVLLFAHCQVDAM